MIVEPPPAPYFHKEIEALKLLTDPKLQPLFQKISSEYLYWDKVKYIVPKDIDKRLFWQAVKIQRRLSAQTIRFGNYTFQFTITKNMLAVLHDFDMNFGGNLGSQSIIPNTDKDYYLISSIMEEAIASSQMEGASTTRKVAKEMLRKNLRPTNKSQQMIVNNYETIHKITKKKNDTFSINNLLDIHRCITSNTLESQIDEGVFRRNDNILVVDGITGNVAHTPPPFSDIDDMIKDLCVFANSDSEDNFIHPIIKGIIIHFVLAFIHPFVDGNGRTARSLFYWYMIKKGYWLTEYLSISRIIYTSKKGYEKSFLYTESDELDLSYFIHFHLEVMKKAYMDLQNYLQRKIDEQRDIIRFFDIPDINDRQRYILRSILDNKKSMFIPKELAIQFNVTTKTARADLQELTKLGFLYMTKLNKRAMAFVKSGQFEALIDNYRT